jgi:nucleoside-diphosphate-sugar epimerase
MQKNLQAFNIIEQNCKEVLDGRVGRLEALKNKAIYIAGGTGFVGIWTATLLAYLNEHHSFNTQVFLLARNPAVLNQLAPHLVKDKNITLIENDVRKVFELPSETHYVIHAACTPDSRFHTLNPLETMSIITDGTKNLLSVAQRCSYLEKFLYLSSASVYGAQPFDLSTISEDFLGSSVRSNSAMSAYAQTKCFAETLTSVFRSQYRLPTMIARPFAFVGPYQRVDSPWAINNFVHDVLNGERIKVLGDGRTIRSYLYGSDVAFGLLSMLVHGEVGDTYNLGSDQEIDVKSLAHLVAEKAGVTTEIFLSNLSTESLQASRLVPDTTVAQEQLQLNVSVPLEAAISQTLEWNQLCKT